MQQMPSNWLVSAMHTAIMTPGVVRMVFRRSGRKPTARRPGAALVKAGLWRDKEQSRNCETEGFRAWTRTRQGHKS